MTNLIAIGSRVTTPVTDAEGEVSYVVATLISMNQRLAKIQLDDGAIINVGKTKIEAFIPAPEPKERKPKVDQCICPNCKITDGVFDYNSVKGSAEAKNHPYDLMTSRFWCNRCDADWGAKVRRTEMVFVRAASGRKSADNGDQTAELLRGKDLNETYAIAAKYLGISTDNLKRQYKHLNNGQQRMVLGNRLRKHINAINTIVR